MPSQLALQNYTTQWPGAGAASLQQALQQIEDSMLEPGCDHNLSEAHTVLHGSLIAADDSIRTLQQVAGWPMIAYASWVV